MASKTYVGDAGTQIVLDCETDISGATARSIEVRRPDGTTTSWAASLSGTTAVAYTSEAATFSIPGVWRLQAKVSLGAGVWLGETVELTVYPAFG